MKLLLDHNLSHKLVAQLAELYPGISHVTLLSLDQAADLEVWERAARDNFCLVTKDSDFNDLLAAKGFPPKVIWIRLGNCTTGQIAALLRDQHQAILDFLQDDDVGLLELH